MTEPRTEAGRALFDDVRIHNVAQRVKADGRHDKRWLDRILAIEAEAPAGPLDALIEQVKAMPPNGVISRWENVSRSAVIDLLLAARAALAAPSASAVAGESWRARRSENNPFPYPTVPEVEDALRHSLPPDLVYAIAPSGDPFIRWARCLLGHVPKETQGG